MSALTQERIARAAEGCGFKVAGITPGPGTRADVELKCDRSDGRSTIGIWPTSTESELAYLLSRAAFELRGFGGGASTDASDWMV